VLGNCRERRKRKRKRKRRSVCRVDIFDGSEDVSMFQN
jgi:hypothetical protein